MFGYNSCKLPVCFIRYQYFRRVQTYTYDNVSVGVEKIMIRAICDLVDINIHAPVVRPIVRSIGKNREQME